MEAGKHDISEETNIKCFHGDSMQYELVLRLCLWIDGTQTNHFRPSLCHIFRFTVKRAFLCCNLIQGVPVKNLKIKYVF